MPLILAIEPDRRQAAQLSVVVRKRVQAELILVDTTEGALDAIGSRMPDLVLVPALLSPQDDAALAAALRVIAAAACVQMLTIPVLGTPRPAPAAGGMLSALRRGKPRAAEPDGCDPAVFAEQIASYLERAERERPHMAMAPPPADPLPPEVYVEAPVAGADHPERTVEYALNQEWVESPPAKFDIVVEPESGAPPDESVSFALEEAVRGLFAAAPAPDVESVPVPVPVADPVSEPESEPEPAAVLLAVSPRGDAPVESPAVDEWVAVEELMAALQVMPLAAIAITQEDEWLAPDEPRRVVARIEDGERERDQVEAAAETKGPGGKSEHEWVTLIESLRHDVERLRVERSERPARKAAPAPAPRLERKAKPIQDEWGLFDPEQCGFAALLAKLDEVTDSDDGRT